MLPEGWRECRLGDLFESRRERGREGLPILSVTMTNGLVDRNDLDRKQDTALSPAEHLLVEAGDIAYNTMRMWQGAFGLADRDGMVSPAYVVLRTKPGADPRFMAQLLRTPRLRYLLRAYSYGLTDDRLRLYFDDFAAIHACIPGIEEQAAIACVLGAYDQSVEALEQLITNRKRHKQALFSRLLVEPAQRPFLQAAAWKHSTLGMIAEVASGGTPDRSEPSYWGGDVPWVTTGEIQFNTIIDTTEKISTAGLKNSSAKLFPPGTLLMAMYGQGKTRGQVAKLGIEAATNQACAAILVRDGYDPDFYFHLLVSQYASIRELGNAGTQQNLSGGILKSLEVPVPPPEEQRRIAQILTAADREVCVLVEQVQLLKEEKTALMADLLTAKRRVRLPKPEAAA